MGDFGLYVVAVVCVTRVTVVHLARRRERKPRWKRGASLWLVLLACVGLLLAGCVPTKTVPPTSEFVSRRGASLVLEGQTFRYLSYNAFSLLGCGLPDENPTEQEIDFFFQGLRPNSLVRTWLTPNFFDSQAERDRVDRLVGIAASRSVKLIFLLTDANGECGDPEGAKSSAWFGGGFRNVYLPHVRAVVQHYRDNPAVGMWELINEPSGVSNSTLRAFFDEAGGEIHSRDPNHLVESGTFPPWAYGGNAGWQFIHESSGIDVASLHEYDMNAGASPHLAGAVAAADAIGKPLILGEVGIFASTTGDLSQSLFGHPCVSFAQRVSTFEAKLDATFATSIDGVNVWNWFPRNKQSCRLETYPGDPLVAMIQTYALSRGLGLDG
jgi:hypothetical protein